MKTYANNASPQVKVTFLQIVGTLILTIFLMGWHSTVTAGSLSCNAKVSLNGQTIEVQPNGSNDTENIQCALDEAKAKGYTKVRLVSGNFKISSIHTSDFSGTLEGKSKAATTLNILDASINCEAMELSGRTTAAIKFDQGEPRIRFMTIKTGSPCTSSATLSAAIHFSGSPADGIDCSNDVVFGVADRIILEGVGVQVKQGILAAGESYEIGGCKNNLLGTLKVNQSSIKGFRYGIETSMKSGAQVDINFTNFEQNRNNIWIQDSNQSTTITNNIFTGSSNSMTGSHTGIRIITNNSAPPKTTTVTVKNNTFNVTENDNFFSWAILSYQLKKIEAINLIIINNIFNLSGDVAGVAITDVSNGVVMGNKFAGTAVKAIEIGTNGLPALDWVLSKNSGFDDETFAATFGDIHLGSLSENTIVGSGQGGTVIDHGTNNTIIQ